MSIENSDADLGRAIFRGSFGGSGRSGSGRSGSGNATIMTGLALSDSVEGRVLVDTGGQTVAASQGVDLPCTCNVRAGDKVIITLVGNDPTVTGVVGRGDQQQSEIDGAQSSADAANKRAEEARRFAEEVDGKVSDAQADMDAAKRQAEQAKAAADAASRKADQLSGKVTDVTTTVSGLSTKVEGAARDATSALTASSKTSQSLGALTSTVEQHYTEQQATAGKADRAARDAASSLDRVSKVEQTAAGIQTQATAASKTAADALSRASTAQQTADAITTTVARDYLSKAGASQSYASKSSVAQTADGIRNEVASTYQTKAGMSAYAEKSYVDQKADSITATVAKKLDSATAASTYAKSSELKQTADGLSVRVTKAQGAADAASSAASSANSAANDAKATAATAKATASSAASSASRAQATADSKVGKGSSGISSLETAMQFDSSGLSIFKKVNNAISGFIAKVTGSAFQICDRTGRVLSQFTDKRIDLGKNSSDTVISMCQDNARIFTRTSGRDNDSYLLFDSPAGQDASSTLSIGFVQFDMGTEDGGMAIDLPLLSMRTGSGTAGSGACDFSIGASHLLVFGGMVEVNSELTVGDEPFSRASILYDSGGWTVVRRSGLVLVDVGGVTTGGGSWDTTTCPYVLPDHCRPKRDVFAALVTANGGSWTGQLAVRTNGTITVTNIGNSGSTDGRYGSLSYPIGPWASG